MKFVEYGLKNSVSVGSNSASHILDRYRNVNQENVTPTRSSIHGSHLIP